MAPTIFQSPFFINIVLPFLLIFTIVYAILQKSEVLGKDKKQIDAIVGLVIGLIVVSFGNVTGYIINLMPFLAVSLVVIVVFMILFGSVHAGPLELNKGVKVAFGIISAIAVVIAVLVVTGSWDYILKLFGGGVTASSLATNVIFIVLIIGAIAVVIGFSGKSEKGG